jgi:hypothetical protein
MVSILLIRLLPSSKTDAVTFKSYVKDIVITAFGKTVRTIAPSTTSAATVLPPNTVQLGVASGLATPSTNLIVTTPSATNPVTSLDFSILQHYEVLPLTLQSVATAVIVINLDSSQTTEFPPGSSYNVSLQITRDGVTINDDTIEYNVTPTTVSALSTAQTDYMGMSVNPIVDKEFTAATTSAYVIIPPEPANLNASAPSITLNQNGQAPEFNALLSDITAVLKRDDPLNPPTASSLAVTPLSASQALTVASDLIYNRSVNPPPTVPAGQTIESLYGPQGDDNSRAQFEASLSSYHAQNDADALRLSGYVFAASAALYAERLSAKATSVDFTIPVDSSIQTTSGTNSTALVILSSGGSKPLEPHFGVPAAFFYALGVSLPAQNDPDQRYQATLIKSAQTNAADLKSAVDMGVLSADSQPLLLSTDSTPPKINSAQAVRRLAALGGTASASSVPTIVLTGDAKTIVTAWLKVTDPTDTTFWAAEYPKTEYLDLILQLISDGNDGLKTAILALLPGATVADKKAKDLPTITDAMWQALFKANPGLLPDFTIPGSTDQRSLAYIAFIRKIFTVGFAAAPNKAPASSSNVPVFALDGTKDVLRKFGSAYPGGFSFSAALNDTQIDTTLASVFTGDIKTQKWVKNAIETISSLFKMTNLSGADPGLKFSYMEALYARGFVTVASVVVLSKTQFTTALSGTVAYSRAGDIWTLASSLPSTIPNMGPEQGAGFASVNPGNLVDCIPPPNLSPLGLIQYLHEALGLVSAGSTLGDAIAARRGPLRNLLASKANLETELPLIDLVNESLESLGSNLGVPPGAVYNTTDTSLDGFDFGSGPKEYDSEVLLAAIPQHSAPAVPVQSPVVYDTMRTTFTSPDLPYSEPLDVCRSNLCHIGTNRFEAMRTFREDITELPMNSALEPSDFQRNLSRYPVRFETALEYLKISAEEYAVLFSGKLEATQIVQETWFQVIDPTGIAHSSSGGLPVSSILAVTGLTYYEFIELWKCGFVKFSRAGDEVDFPKCEPYCLDNLMVKFDDGDGDKATLLLAEIIIFVRLWKKLQRLCGERIPCALLTDICMVLGLATSAGINPDFIKQLASLLMLHDHFGLPWSDCQIVCDNKGNASEPIGEKRTKLLALWVGPKNSPEEWTWALDALLDGVDRFAVKKHHCHSRGPEYRKIIKANLKELSLVAGFTDAYPWNFSPTCTIRFAEVLAKINASEFTVGEIIFLFTDREHLNGDDPFPLTKPSDSIDDPLNVPEDDKHGLWNLRHKLLKAEVSDENVKSWTWYRIESCIREMGFGGSHSTTGSPDALLSLGAHFFPETLESVGQLVDKSARLYRTDLPPSSTSPHMWRAEPCDLFHYHVSAGNDGAGKLWLQLPVENEKVLHKLTEARQLNAAEINAVQDLYFAPRATLAPFALLFSNFGHAVDYLVQEPNERERFRYFQRQFALFHRRCEIIATHIALQVGLATGCHDEKKRPQVAVAWRVLNNLIADENFAKGPWENDAGTAPSNFVWDRFSGNAFAAILGLIGTGLCGEYTTKSGEVWKELRGGTEAFGRVCNEWNVPVPTVLPSMTLTPTAAELDIVTFKNGLALHEGHGHKLGGAEPFKVCWSGVLLIDKAGHYRFSAGHPRPEGEEPTFERQSDNKWLVTLQRGQKTWTLLNNGCEGEHAPPNTSAPIRLQHGAYRINVHFNQISPQFRQLIDIKSTETGFQLKYNDLDTEERPSTIPFSSLILEKKPGRAQELGRTVVNNTAKQYLQLQYISSLRDIRRTYQRTFKAVLYAHRFSLHADKEHCDEQSELGFMLDHAERFMGTSYYQPTAGSGFKSHHSYFDFNLLPVSDVYFPPNSLHDSRANPSMKRQAALFSGWERTFDYVQLRSELERLHKRPLWLLFQKVEQQNPTELQQVVRYLHIDTHLSTLVLTYSASPLYNVVDTDLLDERWAIRIWQAGKWIQEVQRSFFSEKLDHARPALWAADDPNAVIEAVTGNQNLVQFVQQSSLASMGTPRRFKDVKKLNDGLRERARAALFAFLCGRNRVPLTALGSAGYAATPRDLSDLLLQDVEVGLHERSSRIEDAIHAVQTFVQRARIGVEPSFKVVYAFSRNWECRFSSFETWVASKRREIYRENWIHWEAIHRDEKTEGFRFLKTELRNLCSTLVTPGRPLWWADPSVPSQPKLESIQTLEGLTLEFQQNSLQEGLSLIGTPGRGALPTLLAPNPVALSDGGPPNATTSKTVTPPISANSSGIETLTSAPLWVQAAVRLGTMFIRVAASSVQPAVPYSALQEEKPPCCQCGKAHPPLIDEYYFWLQDASRFDYTDARQDADIGATATDPSSAWEDPSKLPKLLYWPSEPMVHLFWTRVRCGVLDPPRRSDYGIPSTGTVPDLQFVGRTSDSLIFTALPSNTTAGFRYDIVTDTAVVTPQVVPDTIPPPPSTLPGLNSYPYFVYFEPGAPLFPVWPFATALVIAGRLRSNCQFEAALRWCQAVYDPLQRTNTWALSAESPNEKNLAEMVNHNDSTPPPDPNAPCCPSSPVTDSFGRGRAVLLEYLDNLLQWGDQLMGKTSMEALQQALTIFNVAQRILGPTPLRVSAQSGNTTMTVGNFVAASAPLNPHLLKLYDQVSDRRALVHDSLNRRRLPNGVGKKEPAPWRSHRRWDDSEVEQTCPADCMPICQPYRFTTVYAKALEWATLVKGLGYSLLSAYEKGDATTLEALRETQNRQLLDLGLNINKDQWRAADWDVQALDKAMESALTKLRYFQGLIDGGLNAGENGYLDNTQSSMESRTGANTSEGTSQAMAMVPDEWFGIAGLGPLQANQVPVGVKLATAFHAAAQILNTVADVSSSNAGMSATQGGWQRRLAEWQNQVDLTNVEIQQIKRQQLAAWRRRAAALQELNNHQRQMEYAAEIQDFIRDRFTKAELYLFLQQETAAQYRQAYNIAIRTAREAQEAFRYERGEHVREFLRENAWNSLHDGLMAGERLELSLREMERAYLNTNCREYELNKSFSLRLHFPTAFLSLKAQGWCEVDIPEWMFDLDYPGHYMRRIKNIKVTIPCVAGPYTGVHCRLSLQSSLIRMQPLIPGPEGCCCSPKLRSQDMCEHDPYVVRRYAATEAIATSTGQDDTGLFELNFRDERYLPFEFAGAVSRWRIELPPANNQFDMDTLSDFVMNFNYTSREGGHELRAKAAESSRLRLPGGGIRFFDVRHEFPDLWRTVLLADASQLGGRHRHRDFPLRLRRSMFPFLTGCRDVRVARLHLFVRLAAADARPGRSLRVEYLPPARGAEHERRDDEKRSVVLVAGLDAPALYRGTVDGVRLSAVDPRRGGGGAATAASRDADADAACLRFPRELGGVEQAFILGEYEAVSQCDPGAKCCC